MSERPDNGLLHKSAASRGYAKTAAEGGCVTRGDVEVTEEPAMMRHVVRCSACGKVHLSVAPAELEGQPLDKFRQCSQCGREGVFVPSQLMIDELMFVIPCCIVDEGVCWVPQ